MKILIFYTYNKGLLSNFFQELSEKLSKDGYDVVNFYLKLKKDHFIQNGVSIHGEKRGGLLYNYLQVYKIIKTTKPNIVISNFSYINPAILFGKLLGVSTNIAWFHSAYGHTKPSRLKVINKRLYLKQADIVIANSRLLEKEMHRIYGVSEKKTRCIPFWTNILNYRNKSSLLNINQDRSVFKIGCPGRLLEDKNHQIVIKALHGLKEETKRTVHLYIAGNGLFKNELAQLVDLLGLNENVSFLGVLPVEEMAEFYEHMDVLVLPSLNEAFGLVLIEAMALGRPVIVSSKFGALDFIDQSRFSLKDFTFDPESVSDLKQRLIPYLANKGLQSDYFKTMYNETFDKKMIYDKIKDVLNFNQ